mmetsp:Transcript_16155/g.31892  ORF Transcript_16155/g.31892 Transcript_16155/m.31892 type:complete len:352 (-) Transcript_16155:540-1595(-)
MRIVAAAVLAIASGCVAFSPASAPFGRAGSALRHASIAASPRFSPAGARSGGVLGLRLADEGFGWTSRPPTSVQEDIVRESKARVSVTGTLAVQGAEIKYDYLPGNGPTIMYLPALNRTRHGGVATNLKTWCRANKRSYLVADYFGVGQSEGDYKDASISRWTDDTCNLIEWVAKEHGQTEVVLVGAGVGGWVMLHVAKKMAASVVGLVGVAADPDFTEDLVMPKLSEEIKQKIFSEGSSEFEWGGKTYTLTKTMVEDGKEMTVLDKGKASIDIDIPIHLIQGLGDEEIPPEKALRLSECIKGDEVVITYVKHGAHELENESDFKRIHTAINEIDRYLGKLSWSRSIRAPV